ncbi:MAG: exopolysaccharide Pel transporter PelG [Agathobacter sp.]|nr:exopolysaccharide Pel transporter PelG [Agathobacter sp.]MBQ6811720.1 exopolysaccharide Pel transporter PelG [Agathobacter sp.]
MAGIGFELKKLFDQKGVFALLKAYGYAGVICTGPMILGMTLLLGVNAISVASGLPKDDRDFLTSMITYTLLLSMTITNVLGMVVTRYVADCLYSDKQNKIMPAFYGSVSIMMVIGSVVFSLFLLISGVPFSYAFLLFLFLEELIVAWTQMNFLTAIKDYKGLLKAFSMALVIGLGSAWVLTCLLHLPIISTLLSCMCIAYGIMIVWYHAMLRQFFPDSKGSRLEFLGCFETYTSLIGCGVFMNIGLYGHLIVMWGSPIGVHIQGPFYAAPQYDVPALVAFVSTLVSTINFVTSVEVNFYPKYRTYYSLFNNDATLNDIEQAEKEMRLVLQDELSYNSAKQVFVTIMFIVLGTIILPLLPLGFNDEMLGIFRVLCLGYAFYAIGNSIMLMSLYFADEFGAFVSTFAFAIVSIVATIFSQLLPVQYYGFGFVIGAFVYMLVALVRLMYFIKRLKYYVLSTQPLVVKEKDGLFTKIAKYYVEKKEGEGE